MSLISKSASVNAEFRTKEHSDRSTDTLWFPESRIPVKE